MKNRLTSRRFFYARRTTDKKIPGQAGGKSCHEISQLQRHSDSTYYSHYNIRPTPTRVGERIPPSLYGRRQGSGLLHRA